MEPDRSTELYKAGREKMEAGDYRSAIALFNESNTAFPHFKTLELLGECHLLQEQPLDAIIPLAAAVGLGSNEFRAMYLLAKAFLALGQNRNAIQFLDLALKINPTFKAAGELRSSFP
jgi:tetratricopeptide (TPR) repeat protein